MHLSGKPVSGELVTVRPRLCPIAIRLAEFEMALIVSAIAVCLAPVAVHRIVCPLAVIKRAIWPALQSLTSLQPIDEAALIEAAIAVVELSVPILEIVAEVASVDGVVVGDLAAEAAFLTLLPPALVERSIRLRQRAKALK